MRAAGAGKQAKLCLRQSNQVVALLGDAQIAGERELECAGEGRAGDGRDDRFGHAFAQRHGLVEESTVVGSVLGPLATGGAERLGDLDERGDVEMTIEVTGRAASHDDDTNVGVARECVQRVGEHVAHLCVEVDALWAAQGNDGNSIGHSCRQSISVHRLLPSVGAMMADRSSGVLAKLALLSISARKRMTSRRVA